MKLLKIVHRASKQQQVLGCQSVFAQNVLLEHVLCFLKRIGSPLAAMLRLRVAWLRLQVSIRLIRPLLHPFLRGRRITTALLMAANTYAMTSNVPWRTVRCIVRTLPLRGWDATVQPGSARATRSSCCTHHTSSHFHWQSACLTAAVMAVYCL